MIELTSRLRLVLLLVAATLACDCEGIPSDSYLTFPTDFSTEFHQSIRAALGKIEITPQSEIVSLNGAILDAKATASNPTEEQIYSTIIALQRETDCKSSRKIDTFKSIYAQAQSQQTPNLALWKDFIQFVGESFFENCLMTASRSSKWFIRAELLTELDAVFMAAFDLDDNKGYSTIKLAEKLPEFDLAQETFNATGMVEAVKKYASDKTIEDYFSLFKKFMLDRCKEFVKNEDLREIITAMDLIRYLHGDRSANSKSAFPFNELRLTRVDEYNRLCQALDGFKTGPIIRDNFNRQLNTEKPEEVTDAPGIVKKWFGCLH